MCYETNHFILIVIVCQRRCMWTGRTRRRYTNMWKQRKEVCWLTQSNGTLQSSWFSPDGKVFQRYSHRTSPLELEVRTRPRFRANRFYLDCAETHSNSVGTGFFLNHQLKFQERVLSIFIQPLVFNYRHCKTYLLWICILNKMLLVFSLLTCRSHGWKMHLLSRDSVKSWH